MTESLFTGQVPANTAADDGTPFTLGTLFTADTIGVVEGILWRFPDVPPDSPVVGVLYEYVTESTGTELASATFVAPIAGTWNSVSFASPVAISASTRYVAAVWTSNKYVYSGDFFLVALTNGHLTAPVHLAEQHNGKFHQGGSSQIYPDATFNENCYFVGPLFTPGTTSVDGVLDATFPALITSVTGELTVTGALVGILPTLSIAVQGSLSVVGQLTATLPALRFVATGVSDAAAPATTLRLRIAGREPATVVAGRRPTTTVAGREVGVP